MNFEQRIENYFKAGYPVLWVKSPEENRAAHTLQQIAEQSKLHFWHWTVTEGWVNNQDKMNETDPIAALQAVRGIPENSMLAMLGYHFYLDPPLPEIVQIVKDLVQFCKSTGRYLVFISPVVNLPIELQSEVTVVDFSLPDTDELMVTLDGVLDAVGMKAAKKIKKQAVESARGLTLFEAENAFALSVVEAKKIVPAIIQREKANMIKKSELLEYYEPNETLAEVGGLDKLKEFLIRRKKCFEEIDKARAYHLPTPKGIIVTGIPGTGKSLTAKATSALWNLPLLRWDVGRSFSRYVGESEQQFARVFELARAMAPIILWIDEIEKAFAGASGSGELDSGVTKKTFGQFLTFMEENTDPIFVFATSNDIDSLPPELVRRFDAVYSVGLPTDKERKEIFAIHLRKRERDPAKFNIDTLVEHSIGYSGAEIEKSIITGMYEAFDQGTELTTEHILHGIADTPPIIKVMPEKVQRINEWVEKKRAKPASAIKPKTVRHIRVDNTLGRS